MGELKWKSALGNLPSPHRFPHGPLWNLYESLWVHQLAYNTTRSKCVIYTSNLNLGGEQKVQHVKEIIVYSRKPKPKYKENLTLETPRESESMIALDRHELLQDHLILIYLLLLRNKLGHVLFTLSQNLYLIRFISSISIICS